MGYMTAMGQCWGCRNLFSFNPDCVPAYRGEPICEYCMQDINEKRKANGLEPFHVHPDAYEPAETF